MLEETGEERIMVSGSSQDKTSSLSSNENSESKYS